MRFSLIIGLFVACTTAKRMDGSSLRIISDSIRDFSSRFTRYLGERERFNYVASPLGLGMSLAMLAYGSEGMTAEELYRCLHLPSDPTIGLNGYQCLLNMLKEKGENELIISQKIFIYKDVSVNESYTSMLAQYFHSEIGHVNFKDSKSAAEDINLYVYGRTKQKIKIFIRPEEVNPDTSIISMNVMYFCGKFKTSFNRSLIDQPFYIGEQNTKRVKCMSGMMNQLFYGRISELKASFIEVPYEGRELSLLLIRPDEINGVRDLQKRLEKFTIPRLLSFGSLRDVSVSIPSFNVESFLNLKDIMQKMGVSDMFEDSASFAHFLGRERRIKLDLLIQKVIFNLDERSTMSSGITAYSIPESTLDEVHSTLYSFYLDRPFLFIVLQKDTMIPIFSGRIMDPEPHKTMHA
ncbi:alaserpin-like isoform X2 [Belonocnema kinseyi]|uniref:alaserpin-like isoform X2 n=1 Tax=Belonocnema kinseyi TaxID=2817044 RepID=UPI00143D5DC0|nr:alaserpin-like isoform X2 [Belonocnema kinseyi]